MEAPPPLATYLAEKSKRKRRLTGGSGSSSSSSRMDPDVVEIMPPTAIASKPRSNARKQNEVLHEVIDVDMYADSTDVVLIDEKNGTYNKGKYPLHGTFPCTFVPTSANIESASTVQPLKSFSPGSHNSINLDGFTTDLSLEDDDNFDMLSDDSVVNDHYTFMQAQFDNVDIPPGVEATVPWLKDPSEIGKMSVASSSSPFLSSVKQEYAKHLSGNDTCLSQLRTVPVAAMVTPTSLASASFQCQTDPLYQLHGAKPSSTWSNVADARSERILNTANASTYPSLPSQGDAKNSKHGVKPYKNWWLPDLSLSKKKHTASSSKNATIRDGNSQAIFTPTPEPFLGPHALDGSTEQFSTSNITPSSSQTHMATSSVSKYFSDLTKKKKSFLTGSLYSSFCDPYISIPSEEEAVIPWAQEAAKRQRSTAATKCSTYLAESISNQQNSVSEDILNRYKLFKQFDTIQDDSDHHYTSKGSSLKQPSKNWAKKLQEEWRILEKNLPDTIFVRVYESRLDLLRAVIVGAEGTPYHDGLFFFDVFFPATYPNVPPDVYYHSGGLRLNPNLYESGKVCLSLLNTWSGGKNEKWIPGSSTMLQVLVSIQGLILNAKPYFNEPGYASMSGSAKGEKSSLQYNERTLILSLKTMLYTMRRPPKHFEDLVVGHFCKHAHDILVACKAYTDGAQVGCLVKGGVQDVDEGDKSCSKKFKESLSGYVKLLVKAFKQIGAKDCEKFLC